LPAAGPEELSAYRITGATCNKSSSAHLQKIKDKLKDFNSHRERQLSGISFMKVGASNNASMVQYKTGN
jgi:hypothetical protein